MSEESRPDLFPVAIPQVNHVNALRMVSSANTNNAEEVVDAEGRLWVRKKESEIGIQGLFAEAMGWQLGRLINAPVPDGAFWDEGSQSEKRGWLSLRIPNVVHWSPDRADFIMNPQAIGSMMALDAVIGNPARHAGNILLESLERPLTVRLWAIDHEESLLGYPDDLASLEGGPPDSRNHARGLPLDLAWDHSVDTARRLELVEEDTLRGMVEGCCRLVGGLGSGRIFEALEPRVHSAERIVVEHLQSVSR